MAATILGNPATVITGTAIITLPNVSPVVIVNTSTHADSYWNLSGTTLLPDTLTNTVGLGVVNDGNQSTDSYLLYDTSARLIKKVAGNLVSTSSHVHTFASLTSKPTTLTGYGITDAQPIDADLTSIAGLGYTSTSFLKKTALNTWALDTATYATSSHSHVPGDLPIATIGTLGVIKVGAYLTIDANGVLNGQAGGVGGGGVWGTITGTLADQTDVSTAINLKANAADPVFTTSFGFVSTSWRFSLSVNDLIISYNGVPTGKLSSTGAFTVLNDVTAFGTI